MPILNNLHADVNTAQVVSAVSVLTKTEIKILRAFQFLLFT